MRELSFVPLVTQPHLLTPHAGINSNGSCRWKYSNPSPSDIEYYPQSNQVRGHREKRSEGGEQYLGSQSPIKFLQGIDT